MGSFGAGPDEMASFGALPYLPIASFGAGPGGLASFGALPSLPMGSFDAAINGFVWRIALFSNHRPLTTDFRFRLDPDCQ
jgi:hypothetical protein